MSNNKIDNPSISQKILLLHFRHIQQNLQSLWLLGALKGRVLGDNNKKAFPSHVLGKSQTLCTSCIISENVRHCLQMWKSRTRNKKCRVAPHKAGHVVTLHTACVIVLLLACATRVCLYHKSHTIVRKLLFSLHAYACFNTRVRGA